MTTGFDLDEIERLLADATPGEWVIWFEQINGQADKAIQELIEQVHATHPIGNSLVMLNADGKCPAITGCGPTSANNAALIVAARNSLPTMLTEIRELRAENARLREANGILEDGLQEVGDDYPGSSCQEWCLHQIAQARAALGEPQ